MKKLKKTLLTLVALLAVTAGAWAEEKSETILTNTSQEEYTGEHFKITPNIQKTMLMVADLRYYDSGQDFFSVQTLDGQNISKLDLQIDDIDEASIHNLSLSSGTKSYDSNKKVLTITNVNADYVQISLTEEDQYGIVTISSVTYYYEESGTTVTFTRGTGDKTDEWTMDGGMPAGNVTVSVEYFPQATAAEGALTAATGVAATTSAPLVTLDASKLTGATKLMYLASTDATKPAYDAQGWSDKVPTADSFTEAGNVNVWYYPVGTDDEDPAKTFSDGDICATALTVTLAAAPTYDISFNAANANTIEAGKATVTVGGTAATLTEGKVTGVKMGQQVKMTAAQGYKFRKVEAKKGKPVAETITVVWVSSDLTGSGNTFTKDGVTITAGNIDYSQKNFENGGTFTTTLGNFTKIEIHATWPQPSGEGWSGSNWTGNASSVEFIGDISDLSFGTLRVVFTILPTN